MSPTTMTPKFENYSFEELCQALSTVDRYKYPERVEQIEHLIELRKQERSGGGFVESGEQYGRKAGRWYAIVRRFSARTIFSISFIGLSISSFVIIIVMGVASALGADFVKYNDVYVHGPKALGIAGIVGLVLIPVTALTTALGTYIGLRVYSLFAPMRVEVIVDENSE